MANKTFKARFKQLIAPLSAWQSGGTKASFEILPGEIAFATAEAHDNNGVTAPIVLVKVNNGSANATWESLPDAIYARASDVYSWAKKSGITVDDSGTGTVISKIKWENDKLIVERRGLTNDDLAGLTIGNALHANAATQVDHTITVLGEAFNGSADVEITAQEVYDAIKDKVEADDANTTYTLDVANNDGGLIFRGSDNSSTVIKVDGDGIANVSFDNTNKQIIVDVSTEATETKAGLLSALDKAKIDKLAVNADGTIGGTIESAAKVEHTLTIAGESFNGSADVEITADEIYTAIEGKDKNETFAISYDKDNKLIKLTGTDGTNSEIPTDDFIKDGMIESVVLSEDGKSLIITWNTDAEKEQSVTTISLSALVDAYTGGTTDDIIVSISDQNVITAVLTEAIKTELAKARTFAAGDVLSVGDKDGVITYSHEAIAAPTGTAGSGRTYLTGVSTDGHGHITGFTTATESDQAIPEYTLSGDDMVHDGGDTLVSTVYLKKDGEDASQFSHRLYVKDSSQYNNANPLVTQAYVDTAVADGTKHSHNIEDLTQVDYVIFDANI